MYLVVVQASLLDQRRFGNLPAGTLVIGRCEEAAAKSGEGPLVVSFGHRGLDSIGRSHARQYVFLPGEVFLRPELPVRR